MREAARRAWRAFSGSLSAKVFAGLFCLLSAAGLALYAVVAAAFPQSYDAALGVRTDARIAEVGAELARLPLSEGVEFLSSWCAQTGFVATLSTDERSWTFGNVGEATSEVLVAPAAEEDDGEPLITAVSEVSFADGASGMLALIGSPADEAFFGEVFQGLLPPVLLLIAAVSAAGAWLVSRLVARPIVEVSGISQRLAALDFTWRCPEGRRDEVGALGRNLNAMAEDLARAMEDLERANERLTREMEAVRALAGERKAFFAAAGHELKTPLAVMRAQVEGMQLGIGDFADHGRHLPRVLAAVERMEALVRDILEASRLDAAGEGAALAREPVDVVAAVRAAVAEVEPLARERGVTFEVRVEGEAEAAGVALGAAAEGAALARGDASAEGEASPFAAAPTALAAPDLLAKAIGIVVGNAALHAPAGSAAVVRVGRGSLAVENPCGSLAPQDAAALCNPSPAPTPRAPPRPAAPASASTSPRPSAPSMRSPSPSPSRTPRFAWRCFSDPARTVPCRFLLGRRPPAFPAPNRNQTPR